MRNKGGIIMRRYSLAWLFSILLSLVVIDAIADTLEVIELRHRTAESLIPVVRPLLDEQSVVTGRGNQLIVRTDPAQLQQLRNLLRDLDTPLKQLLISVRQQGQTEDSRSAAGISGSIELGREGRLTIGNGFPGEGAQIGIADGNNRRSDRVSQQVRVIDGGEAYIRIGEERPIQERYVVRDGRRLREYTSTQYQPLTTGFYVRPRLQGDQVTLEVYPQQQRALNDRRFATQDLATTVSGRLGEWLPIGISNIQSTTQNSGLLNREQNTVSDEHQIMLKVELVR